MNSQDFLTLNLVGASAFVLWYVTSRGGLRRPIQLNLKAKDSAPPLMNPLPENESSLMAHTATMKKHTIPHPDIVGTKPKNLNVMFMYNSHTWDAYEVLGVPAGSSIKAVTEAYESAVKNSNQSSAEFLETAYKAILNKAS